MPTNETVAVCVISEIEAMHLMVFSYAVHCARTLYIDHISSRVKYEQNCDNSKLFEFSFVYMVAIDGSHPTRDLRISNSQQQTCNLCQTPQCNLRQRRYERIPFMKRQIGNNSSDNRAPITRDCLYSPTPSTACGAVIGNLRD